MDEPGDPKQGDGRWIDEYGAVLQISTDTNNIQDAHNKSRFAWANTHKGIYIQITIHTARA